MNQSHSRRERSRNSEWKRGITARKMSNIYWYFWLSCIAERFEIEYTAGLHRCPSDSWHYSVIEHQQYVTVFATYKTAWKVRVAVKGNGETPDRGTELGDWTGAISKYWILDNNIKYMKIKSSLFYFPLISSEYLVTYRYTSPWILNSFANIKFSSNRFS